MRPSALKLRLLMGIAAMGYGKLVSIVVQLAMVPVLASNWGLALYGQWLLLSAIPIFLGASDFGFGTAAGTRMIAEVAGDALDEAVVTFRSAWIMILSTSTAIAIVALACCLLLPTALFETAGGMPPDAARGVLGLLCLYGIVALQSSMFMAVARAVGRFPASTSLDATVQLTENAAVVGAVMLGGSPLQAALTFLCVRLLGVLAHVLLARRLAPWLRLGLAGATRRRIRELWRPALGAMALPIAQAGFLQGTALAVGAAAGPQAVPIYTSLRTLSRVGMQALMVLSLAIMPEFTAAHARGEVLRLSKILRLTLLSTLILGLAFAVGLGVFGRPFIQLWTRGVVTPPQTMVTLTAIAVLASALWNPLSNLLLALNRHARFAAVYLVGTAVTTALTYVLVLRMGISGAALSSLLLDGLMLGTVGRAIWRFYRSDILLRVPQLEERLRQGMAGD